MCPTCGAVVNNDTNAAVCSNDWHKKQHITPTNALGRRWNHLKMEMEDWWPGKCCGRSYAHPSTACTLSTTPYHPSMPYTPSHGTVYRPEPYVPPPKPWDGIDRKRFPRTYMCLVLLYHSGEWYQMTRTQYENSSGRYGYYDYKE